MPTKEFFVAAYEGAPPPWDLGRPQRDLVMAFDELGLTGSVVDLGCGTGEHVLDLARRGLDAWGVDSTPSAIAAAERKRETRGLTAKLICGDALDLKALGRRFDAVLDCGLFHVIAEEERLRYVRELDHVLGPGGRFLMLGFQPHTRERGPRGYTPEELRNYLAGYREVYIRPATYETNDSTDGMPAWLSLFEHG
jgi:SAM-dependent methyltransferase